MRRAGKASRLHVFPPNGSTPEEGHHFCYGGSQPPWGEEVLAFLRESATAPPARRAIHSYAAQLRGVQQQLDVEQRRSARQRVRREFSSPYGNEGPRPAPGHGDDMQPFVVPLRGRRRPYPLRLPLASRRRPDRTRRRPRGREARAIEGDRASRARGQGRRRASAGDDRERCARRAPTAPRRRPLDREPHLLSRRRGAAVRDGS